MISLTPPQREMLTHIVRERSIGREPSYRSLAIDLGFCGPGPAFKCRAALERRVSREEIEAIVPRGPDGERLRFIPFFDPAGRQQLKDRG